MKQNVMLIIEGTFAALTLFWIVKNPQAVGGIITAGSGATVGAFQNLIGGGRPNAGK